MDLRSIVATSILAGAGLVNHDEVEGYLYSRAGVAAYISDAVPTPAPSGKCETCNGSGKVGDGRVFSDCLDCGGDGIVARSSDCDCEVCGCEVCQCGLPGQVSTVAQGGVCGPSGCSPMGAGVVGDGEVAGPVARIASAVVCGDGPVRRVLSRKPVRSILGHLLRR